MRQKTLHRRKRKYFLLILLLCLAGMTKMYAYDFSAVCETGQTLYYNIIDATNHYVELTCPGEANYSNCWAGFDKPTGDISLPESVQYDGVTYTVTSIGDYAFYNCSNLTGDLSIPNSVTTIGGYAFYGCNGFTGDVTIGNSVTFIGAAAFANCENVTSIHFNASHCESMGFVEDENYWYFVFYNNNSLNEIVIGDNVTSIPIYAFANHASLNCQLVLGNAVEIIDNFAFYNDFSGNYPGLVGNLTIPNSVTTIGAYAFYGCSGFTGDLTIPNSVTTIGAYAFYGCSGFTGDLTIPNSVTSIGTNPFCGCTWLEQIEVAPGNTVYDSRNNCNAIIHTNTNKLISGCKNTVIPNSVTSIESYAFYSCTGLTSITIPNSVTTIGSYAFYSCSGLTSMTILAEAPPTLVGNYVFYYVNKTMSMYVPCASLLAYQNTTGWNEFTNYMPATTCAPGEITVTINPIEGGTVTGDGYYDGGEVCTLTAVSNPGYSFINWTKDGVVVSDSENFSFIVSGDASFVANFEQGLLVHNGNITNGYVPIFGYYADAYLKSQTVYPASELSAMIGKDITNMKFFASQSDVSWGAANFQVFMTEVADATINAFTSPGTIVYEGTLSIVEGMMDVVFSNPYHYNGGNLLVSFYNTVSGTYVSSTWYGENVTGSSVQGYGYTSLEAIAATQRNFLPKTLFLYDVGIVPETNLSDEICHGEDYHENGFEIIQPEVGENEYSITLPSSQGLDSIVNLTLTVYPTYYIVEDTTLCNASSFTWRGHTYSESGIYYDSLQTIHGCDSIYALSLEFFNTPLGEFTYMTPTNNYLFTSLPITFSWETVSGAEYYDFYLWNVNEPVPSTPFAGNIYNRSCYVPSLQNHQTYNWYVEAVNTCFSTTSSVRSFTLNIPPSMNISASSLNFGEVVLNNSNTLNLFVSGNALDDTITMQITGEDASMFSFERGSNWNGLTGGLLSVAFSPTTVKYNYTANLVITTGTLTQTVQLTGSLADMFVFNTYVTQDVFEMNSTIPIYGTVLDVNNNPMAGAEVEVKVMVMGTTRSLSATTGDDGHFSVEFVPAYSESGYYTVNSGRMGHSSTAVHDDFNIPGMSLVTNDWILWDVVQNETTTGSIVIRNRSQIPLTNIQVTATNLPEGCSFTFQPLSLQGMEEGVLEYSVTGSALTSGNNYEEVRLVATSAEGATMNFSAWYYCAEPRGILYAAPNNIITTMTKGNSKIVDVMLYNNGTGPTGNVYYLIGG